MQFVVFLGQGTRAHTRKASKALVVKATRSYVIHKFSYFQAPTANTRSSSVLSSSSGVHAQQNIIDAKELRSLQKSGYKHMTRSTNHARSLAYCSFASFLLFLYCQCFMAAINAQHLCILMFYSVEIVKLRDVPAYKAMGKSVFGYTVLVFWCCLVALAVTTAVCFNSKCIFCD